VDVGWSDVGSWSALCDVLTRDGDGNISEGDVINVDTTNSFVHADGRLVATVGLDSVVVVETADAVLVADKDAVQNVKNVVDDIKRCTRTEHHIHQKVYRPWGSYESVEDGHRYQVKRITVNPGASLSLQMHHHRSEHWIVVTGTAKVERDAETFILSENESTYIPLGAKHRLSNPGKLDLELIEVQVGAYLGEDDIERFDDLYNRL
jgi:mannose-1-phosphate guanylyltransferase/mannose-6-phosphate isomerase